MNRDTRKHPLIRGARLTEIRFRFEQTFPYSISRCAITTNSMDHQKQLEIKGHLDIKTKLTLLLPVYFVLLFGCGDSTSSDGRSFSERAEIKVMTTAFKYGCKQGGKDKNSEDNEAIAIMCQCATEILGDQLTLEQWRRMGNITGDDLDSADQDLRNEIISAIGQCKDRQEQTPSRDERSL